MSSGLEEQPSKTRDLATPTETFAALADEYSFDQTLAKALVTSGCASLHDFRYLVSKEDDLKTAWFDLAGDPGKKAVEKARGRRAWHGVRSALAGRAKLLPAAEEDLDQLLPSEDLESLDQHFFARYHFVFLPNRMLSDVQVSRLVKEVMRRSLTLKDMGAVKNQLQQNSRTIKRRRVAGNLFTHDEEDEDVQMETPLDADSLAGYLNLLALYLHGLAKAGCKPLVPPPSTAETSESNAEDYVQIPLSVLQHYLWRCEDATGKLPIRQRLTFLRAQDLAERAEWATRFRAGGTKTLGKIITEVFRERSAHWDVAMPRMTSSNDNDQGGLTKTDVGEPGTCATKLRDGAKLCKAFNSSSGCHNGDCDTLHRCGMIIKSGRVCGSWGHGYHRCNRNK